MRREDENGNVEYKLLLQELDDERREHLVTQMVYRLNEGHGEAFYILGLSDDGEPIGLSDNDLKTSLENLKVIAQRAGASMQIIRTVLGERGAIAEVYLRKSKGWMPIEVSVALMGNVDAGKSTLKGVLTSGSLDNGNGAAMSLVARYIHEIKNRRTSSISVHILGFNNDGKSVNDMLQVYSESEIYLRSSKIIHLIDLAGHERYFKTTLRGIMGNLPDYVILVVSLSAGPIGTFKEHLGIALALKIPIIIVFTKSDLAPPLVSEMNIQEVIKLLKMPGVDKIPVFVKDTADISIVSKNISNGRIVPMFILSNRTGSGLDTLKNFINFLPKRVNWEENVNGKFKMYIDDIFEVMGVGTVVSGLIESGTVVENSELIVGPFYDGEFRKVKVQTIQKNRVSVSSALAGQYVTLAISKGRTDNLTRGMVLLAAKEQANIVRQFDADVRILHHPTLIKAGYEPVIQFKTVKEVAKIIKTEPEYLRSGDFGRVTFQFKY
ncbi:MAG: GTP-binding protein, partial [Conexivisphaerales archaeon]